MRTAPIRHAARPAFTLVELLAVIAIIAVLIGLTTAAVQKVRHRTLEVRTRHDISQMAISIDAAKVKYGVDWIPSYVALREDGNYGANKIPAIAALEVQTAAYLKKIWPRLATPATPNFLGHDWNGDGIITPGDAGTWVLEGDQCLVFFLGGIQRGGVCTGFSVDKAYPTRPPQGYPIPPGYPNAYTATEPILYDFPSSRLQVIAPNPPTRSQFHASFIDQYGQIPYAYFSSRSGVGYSADCPTLGVSPYFVMVNGVPTSKPYNPDGFQIISAGYDLTFGLGGPFDAAVGAGLAGPGVSPGMADDLTNFHPTILGSGTK